MSDTTQTEDSTVRLKREITEAVQRYQVAAETQVSEISAYFLDSRTRGGNRELVYLDRITVEARQ